MLEDSIYVLEFLLDSKILLHVCIHKQMEVLQTYRTMVKAFYEDHFSLIKYDLSYKTYVLAFNSQV